MDRNNRSWPLRVVAGIWRGLDRLRRLLHLILLLGLFLLLLIGAVGERVWCRLPRRSSLRRRARWSIS